MLDERPLSSRSCIVDIAFMTSRFPSFTTMADPPFHSPHPSHSHTHGVNSGSMQTAAGQLSTCRRLRADWRRTQVERLQSTHAAACTRPPLICSPNSADLCSARPSHHRQRLGHVFTDLLTAACSPGAGPKLGLRPLSPCI